MRNRHSGTGADEALRTLRLHLKFRSDFKPLITDGVGKTEAIRVAWRLIPACTCALFGDADRQPFGFLTIVV